MKRLLGWTTAGLVATITVSAASPKFTSVFKTPAAREVTFAGKKPVPLGVGFMVTNIDTGWCIADEDAAVVLPSMPSPPGPTPSR